MIALHRPTGGLEMDYIYLTHPSLLHRPTGGLEKVEDHQEHW